MTSMNLLTDPCVTGLQIGWGKNGEIFAEVTYHGRIYKRSSFNTLSLGYHWVAEQVLAARLWGASAKSR